MGFGREESFSFMVKYILSFLLIILPLSSNADPVFLDNDWNLIDQTIVEKLYDEQSNIELFVEKGTLLLRSGDKLKSIYKLDKSFFSFFRKNDYDIYLIREDQKNKVYIFDRIDQKLLMSNLNDENSTFQELDWMYMDLKTIIKTCDKTQSFFMIEKITDNSFLTRYEFSRRPKSMQFEKGYFIGGGRLELAMGDVDMMIVNNDMEYAGTLSSIGSIYDGICEFYPKLIW